MDDDIFGPLRAELSTNANDKKVTISQRDSQRADRTSRNSSQASKDKVTKAKNLVKATAKVPAAAPFRPVLDHEHPSGTNVADDCEPCNE